MRDARLAAADAAYTQIWDDFLHNRFALAVQKASALLRTLEAVEAGEKDADVWATEADFHYIAGAAGGNESCELERALEAYDRCLSLEGHLGENVSARRMRAEALLRLRRYAEAFAAFSELGRLRASGSFGDVLVPAFRLRHDAALMERLARLGRLDASEATAAAGTLRTIAGSLEGRDRPRLREIAAADRPLLRAACLDEIWRPSPYPPERLERWAAAKSRALNAKVDWSSVEADYLREGLVVVDDFFSQAALDELWAFATEAPCFRTVRAGFLGAFPGDGCAHPLIMRAAIELEERLPRVLGPHPLGLWWLFKYTDEGPKGIGIHADAAAVNLNIWLTPDAARRSGGGLDIFQSLPPSEAAVQDFNREFASPEKEAEFRRVLEAGGVRHVEYKRNRAAIFVSDLYHVSEPFDFVDTVETPRVNLTLLFGDRQAQPTGDVAEPSAAAPADADAWDLFD